MITAFTLIDNNRKFRFKAVCINKYTAETPKYNYTCNGHTISQDDYERNLTGFKQSRQ